MDAPIRPWKGAPVAHILGAEPANLEEIDDGW